MKKSKRYDTSHFIEDQYEPGARSRNKIILTADNIVHKI